MERSATKQVRFGRPCERCKAYFVTEDPNSYMCQWCQKSESGIVFDTEYDSGMPSISGGEERE
jgi:hypothetical protein